MPVTSSSDQPPLRLALSGGGFRATLFHLGVLRALLEADRLRDVTHIASVSGGSILAAHAVLNWERLIESPASFQEVSTSLLELVRSDVRNRIVRRLPFLMAARLRGRQRTATDELETFFRIFYRDAKLLDLGGNERPKLAILGTNVGRARLCWFTSDGFSVLPSAVNGVAEVVGRDLIQVAEAVAASAAFPAFFPPKRLLRDHLRYDDESKYQYVTDAGVYDNLALSCFLKDPLTGSVGVFEDSPGTIIVCDATATIDWDSEQRPGFIQNLLRSVDIIHQRSSDLLRQKAGLVRRASAKGDNVVTERAGAGMSANDQYVLIDIEEDRLEIEPCIAASLQRFLSYLRTDFDSFNDFEIHYLVQHGYSVAWHALERNNLAAPQRQSQFALWRGVWPSSRVAQVDSETAARTLSTGSTRTVKWFSWADSSSRNLLATFMLGGVVTIVVLILAGFSITRYLPESWRPTKFVFELPLSPIEERNRAVALIEHYLVQPIREGPRPADEPPAPMIDPEYSDLTIASLERVYDLRKWIDVTQPGATDELAQIQTTYLVIRQASRSNVVFQFKTSGREVRPWVDKNFEAQSYRPVDNVGDVHYPRRWQVDVSIDSRPPLTPFSLTVGGTYVNAFQSGHLDAAFKAYTDSERGTIILLFPENRQHTDIRVFETINDHANRVFGVRPELILEHKSGLFMSIRKPQKDHTYGVAWDWK